MYKIIISFFALLSMNLAAAAPTLKIVVKDQQFFIVSQVEKETMTSLVKGIKISPALLESLINKQQESANDD